MLLDAIFCRPVTLELFSGESAQISGSHLLLTSSESGYDLVAAAFEHGAAGAGEGESHSGQEMAPGKMAAQFAGGVFPALIGCRGR